MSTDKQVLNRLLSEFTNRIELIPGQPVRARYLGPHQAETISLFGANVLDLPWDSRQPRQDILDEVQKRNPGCVVYWEGTL